MDDKKIRKILIEYLKTTVSEIRVYQEKSIGSSVCDIMTVTDWLTGYEIKSDRDNYQRLESQIKAYNRFFDKNYIVVGANHRNSVSKKVPEEWGILVVEETGINVIRNAKKNKYNGTHYNQLKKLWKIELKNILTKFDLPLYTYKSKNYIVDSIIEALDSEQIKNSVVYELMHRDYSLFDAKDHTSNTGSTERYAKMLGERLDLPTYSLNNASIPFGAEIIYLGWVMASSVKGYKKAFRKYKVKAVCGVCMAATGSQISELRKQNAIPQSIPVFTLQGGFDIKKLHGIYKFMMNTMIKVIGKGLVEKADRTPEEDEMLDMALHGGDKVSENNLTELLNWYDEQYYRKDGTEE